MGSEAPLVQPAEPGQTVPGVAPSSKFTKSNGAPVVDVAASTPRFRASEESGPASQDARSRMHPKAVTLPPRHGTWILMGSLRGGGVEVLSVGPREGAQDSHLPAARQPRLVPGGDVHACRGRATLRVAPTRRRKRVLHARLNAQLS